MPMMKETPLMKKTTTHEMFYSWPSMNSMMMKPKNMNTLMRKERLILKVK
jgi:hypothetical protein